MANYFVDQVNGNNGNSGLTTDLAWADPEYAVESGGLAAGDKVWCRRNVNYTSSSDIVPAYSGSASGGLIYLIGCPRASHAVSSSDWTNGSTSVTIDDNDMDREKHQSRYITAPDGDTYLVTRVVSSSSIVIDREYVGSTVSNQAATILADTDYAEFAAIDDSAWTIKIADWLADADDLAIIDFNDAAYQWHQGYTDYWSVRNFELIDSSDSNGIFHNLYGTRLELLGCLFKQNASNARLITNNTYCDLFIQRCIFEGSGAGNNQDGMVLGPYGAMNKTKLKDVAIYNCGNNGIFNGGHLTVENVNVGVEIANGDDDIQNIGLIEGNDLALGGTNGDFEYGSTYFFDRVRILNYQKILGGYYENFPHGVLEKVAVSGETPNKKLSDDVVKITMLNTSNNPVPDQWLQPLFVHEIDTDTSARNYKYWIYNNTGDTLNNGSVFDVFIKIKYIGTYDDETEYIIDEELSDEINIADAADADDWDYVEVTAVTPDTAARVLIEFYYRHAYGAGDEFYIDPKLVIS